MENTQDIIKRVLLRNREEVLSNETKRVGELLKENSDYFEIGLLLSTINFHLEKAIENKEELSLTILKDVELIISNLENFAAILNFDTVKADVNRLKKLLGLLTNNLYLQADSELLEEMGKNQPISLIKTAQSTLIEQVYLEREPEIDSEKPTLFLITGPSGSGKETAVHEAERSGRMPRIVSATNRPRRENESPYDYVWMREQTKEETFEQYVQNLIKEYELVECDPSRGKGRVYGLPERSLEGVTLAKPAIIHTENNGVRTLKAKLNNKFNLIVIFITGESYDQLWERMDGRDNKIGRLEKSVEEIKDAKNIANYYILNNSGIKELQDAFEELATMVVRDEVQVEVEG